MQKIKERPKNLNEIKVKDRVLDLTKNFTSKDVVGEVECFNEDLIIVKFPDHELHTQLRFYGKSWGLLK